MCTNKEKRYKSRFSNHYRAFSHTTEKCWSLKSQVEGLIKKRHFGEYVKKKNRKQSEQKLKVAMQNALTVQPLRVTNIISRKCMVERPSKNQLRAQYKKAIQLQL